MNDLQKLLKLRGISCHDLAAAIGINYHTVQKAVKQARYRRAGKLCVRKPRLARQAIADYLGLTYEQTWGQTSTLTLRRLIRTEIVRKKADYETALAAEYLPDDRNVANNKTACNG